MLHFICIVSVADIDIEMRLVAKSGEYACCDELPCDRQLLSAASVVAELGI
jgi:hypothetical protein